MIWRDYLRVKTREPAFLWRMVGLVLLCGALAGAAAPWLAASCGGDRVDAAWILRTAARGRFAELSAAIDRVLADRAAGFGRLLDLLPTLKVAAGWQIDGQGLSAGNLKKHLTAAHLAPPQMEIALALWNSVGRTEPTDTLLTVAADQPPERYANRALAVYWQQVGISGRAAAAYEREGLLPVAAESRRRALAIYAKANDRAALERLWQTKAYRDQFSPRAMAVLAKERQDWIRLWWTIPAFEWSQLAAAPVTLASLTALFWLAFCLHAAQVDLPRGGRWWLCVAGVLLGVLSVWPTDFLIFWQEQGALPPNDLAGGLRFFILGVGLREESAKLVCLLPLLPLLIRRHSSLETLLVGACVGLGFAAAENSQYFAASHGVDSVSRLLTANFFHMAATGLIGLAICRSFWYPRTHAAESLAVFGVLVAAHGLYDALIALPQLAQYGLGSTIIYVLLCYQFFRELRAARTTRRETISLTATFLFGVSCLTAATFVYLSAEAGWMAAVERLTPEALGVSLMAYVFLREMPETLVTV